MTIKKKNVVNNKIGYGIIAADVNFQLIYSEMLANCTRKQFARFNVVLSIKYQIGSIK